LPTSPALIPLLDRILGGVARSSGTDRDIEPGTLVSLPDAVRRIELPNGVREEAVGAQFRVPGVPGIYRMHGDSAAIGAFAVNAPAAESDLRVASRERLRALSSETVFVDDDAAWRRAIYEQRSGREAWRTFALLALLLLLAEGVAAAAGGVRAATRPAAQEV
jgi:hypothetical protein